MYVSRLIWPDNLTIEDAFEAAVGAATDYGLGCQWESFDELYILAPKTSGICLEYGWRLMAKAKLLFYILQDHFDYPRVEDPMKVMSELKIKYKHLKKLLYCIQTENENAIQNLKLSVQYLDNNKASDARTAENYLNKGRNIIHFHKAIENAVRACREIEMKRDTTVPALLELRDIIDRYKGLKNEIDSDENSDDDVEESIQWFFQERRKQSSAESRICEDNDDIA